MTRDEFISTHGYDPETKVKAHVGLPDEGGGVVDHLKSGAVGIATVPTDVIALPGLVSSGVAGLYRSYRDDTKFLDEFTKSQQIDNAQANIQKHYDEVINHWRTENPSLTKEQIDKGWEDYTKTKQYEDFSRQQLTGAQWLAAEAKNTVRTFLGDERPEHKRSWTETAAEIGGGALIGGPAGSIVRGAAKVPGLAGVAASPVGNAALRVAEAVTPLTIPYSGANVAVNAAAGIGIDQAVRWAEGKPFAFNPQPQDESGVGKLVATGAGVAGLAAFVGAVRGRAHLRLQAAQQTPTSAALEAELRVNDRVSDPQRTGEAGIIAGPESSDKLPASVDAMPAVQGGWRRFKNQFIDQDNISISNIRDEHGIKIADDMEGVVSSSTGHTLSDNKRNFGEKETRALRQVLARMPEDSRRSAKIGAQMSSYAADWEHVYTTNMNRVQELQTLIANPATSHQMRTSHTKELTELHANLQRFVNDDVTSRLRLPEFKMEEVRRIARAFENDTTPEMLAFKKEMRVWSNMMLDMQVRAGKMTQKQADELRIRNPYYNPAMHDPLQGAQGARRLWRSITEGVKNSMTNTSRGTAGLVAKESPIESLDTRIPVATSAPESRITRQLDLQSSMLMYTEKNYVDTVHTLMRNEFNAHHMWRDPTAKTIPTALQKNGQVKLNTGPNGRTHFGVHEQMADTPIGQWVRQQFDNERVVPSWENGRVSFYEYGDVEIARMLRAEPVAMNGLMRTGAMLSQNMKFWTTGHGNPAFALKGAAYDTMVGMVTRAPGRSFGPISTAMQRFLPENVGKHVSGKFWDFSAPIFAPLSSIRALADVMATYSVRWTAEQLKRSDSGFAAMASVMGQNNFNRMLHGAIKLSHVMDMSHTSYLLRRGVGRGSGAVNDVAKIRDANSMFRDRIPQQAKSAYQFYTDVIDAIYLGPKRMFFTENYGHLYRQFNGKIPERELDRLVHDTRTLGGDMTKIPASHWMQQAEAITPYLTQSKLGAYHLWRNATSAETRNNVLPRLAQLMFATAASIYWRTHWDEESSKEFWNKPEHERWRFISIPTAKLLIAWARGENPRYSRDLYYELPLPPDFVGVIAGTGAIMQAIGAIPANATPTPIKNDLMMTFLTSMLPGMPPAAQAGLALGGLRLDPQTADIRGGNIFRSFNPAFKAGPEAEAATTLGQVSTTQSLMLNALWGTFGANLAQGTDVLLHAAKYHPTITAGQYPTARENKDFGYALRLATTEVLQRMTKGIPDVPLLWQNKEKYSTQTPAWKYATEQTNHIRSINGMKEGLGKAAAQARSNAESVGGMPKQALTEPLYAAIAVDVAAYYNPTGRLGKLRKEYGDLLKANQTLMNNYNVPMADRQQRSNVMIQSMQHNQEQQYLSIKYLEQELAKKYGQALAPKLNGRSITVETLDSMMRESIGSPADANTTPAYGG